MTQSTAPLSVADLNRQGQLGGGGQGTVWLVDAPGLPHGRHAYKEYLAASLPDLDVEALDGLVALPATLVPTVRDLLLTWTAWPIATVRRDGAVCGFVMPCASEDFSSYLRFPGGYRSQQLAMEFLLNPVDYMANVDLPITEYVRLSLLRDLAVLLRELHDADVVVGDLSPKNVLVGLRPPRCFLLDCDAMRVHGRSVLPQVETPDWRLPEGEALATQDGDRFKYALLVLRLMQSDQSVSDPDLLRPRFPALAHLVERGMDAPEHRPSLTEWIGAIDEALPTASLVVPVPAAVPPVAAPTGSPGPAGPVYVPPMPVTQRRPVSTALTLKVLAAVGLVAMVVCLGATLIGRLGGGSGSAGQTGPGVENTYVEPTYVAAPTPDQLDPTTAEPAPSQAGIVAFDQTSDPQVLSVAQLFDSYFTAINQRNWDSVLPLYDPNGVVNPNSPAARARLAHDLSTTTDSDVRLHEVTGGGGTVSAHVTFQSQQDPGYGPKSNPNETCTRWDVTYALTTNGSSYRILRSQNSGHSPC